MERDNMIEEMFDDLNMAFIKKLTRVGVDKKEVAKELVKMRYRKVPEGAVVLTKEELTKHDENVRKETAKKYHDKMYRDIEMHNFESIYDGERMIDANDDTLRDFGVEVDE